MNFVILFPCVGMWMSSAFMWVATASIVVMPWTSNPDAGMFKSVVCRMTRDDYWLATGWAGWNMGPEPS